MKKVFTTVIFLLLATISFSQSFELTNRGFFDSADKEKDYVILDFAGRSQNDLYKQTLLYINTIYKSPKNVISTVENESITVNGYAQNAVKRNAFNSFNMDYTMVFLFKDGRMRVNVPSFTLTAFTDKLQTLYLVSGNSLDGSSLGIYNKKGDLKSEKAKASLESFFNGYIQSLKKAIEENKASQW